MKSKNTKKESVLGKILLYNKNMKTCKCEEKNLSKVVT